MVSFLRRLLPDELGQSMVEFSLALPVLVFGLIGGSDLARAFAIQLAIQNGARAGAEAAAINQTPTGSLTAARARDEVSRTPYLNAANATITATFMQNDGLTACTNPPSVAAPCYASVRVQYTFSTIIPWPLVPNSATFDRTTTMRTISSQSGASTFTCGGGGPSC